MSNATLVQVFASELARTEFIDEKAMTLKVVAPISGVIARDLDADQPNDVKSLVGGAASGAPVSFPVGTELQMHKAEKPTEASEYIAETVNPDGSVRGTFAFVTRI